MTDDDERRRRWRQTYRATLAVCSALLVVLLFAGYWGRKVVERRQIVCEGKVDGWMGGWCGHLSPVELEAGAIRTKSANVVA